MSVDVSIVACSDYAPERVQAVLREVLQPVGGLEWVTPGMKIAVKSNIVSKMRPDSAAVVHPVILTELCRQLVERGAKVVVGDSPGGPWNAAWIHSVYATAGVHAVEKVGARLNEDFRQQTVDYPEGVALKSFPFTSWLADVDAVIDVCKLKTHGMTGLSCAVKNFFGIIPGTRKPEFHYQFPKIKDFCNMLVDLNEFIKPRLVIVDAVWGMEGNGPTQGTPRHIGAVLASASPYDADLVAAHLIHMDIADAPTITAAIERGLCVDSVDKLSISGDMEKFIVPDYKLQPVRQDIRFITNLKFIDSFLETHFGTSPKVVAAKCIGCGKCEQTCPVKTIHIVKGRARIDTGGCIRCFCCQEFCPKGAIIVYRPPLARLVGK